MSHKGVNTPDGLLFNGFFNKHLMSVLENEKNVDFMKSDDHPVPLG